MGKDRDGGKGKPVVLKVPVGTQVFDDDRETLIHDFTSLGEKFTLAEGGNGGVGNTHFKSSPQPGPRKAKTRANREQRASWLRAEIIAEIRPFSRPPAGSTTAPSEVSAR